MKQRTTFLEATLISALLITTAHAQPNKLPFIGEKAFTFDWGTGTEKSIKITKNGMTTITLNGTQSSEVIYKGNYRNPIPIDGGKYYYRIYPNHIEQLDKNKQLDTTCLDLKGNQMKCRQELY